MWKFTRGFLASMQWNQYHGIEVQMVSLDVKVIKNSCYREDLTSCDIKTGKYLNHIALMNALLMLFVD